MAFPQVRASIPSEFTETDRSSIVCTHPTGLTAGDLLLIFVGLINFGFDVSASTPSGFSEIASNAGGSRRLLYLWYKVATAGDVSAGSTTITLPSGSDKSGYATMAITGAASGSELTLFEQDVITPSSDTLTVTTAITPIVPESLAISAFLPVDLSLSAVLTASSFSLTPSTTMIERVDVGVRDGSSDGGSLMIATGEYSGTSQITSRAVTVSESINGESATIFVLVNAPVNATATNAFFENDSEFFSPLTGSTQTPSNDFREISPQFFAASAKASRGTNWQTESKPSTNWENEI
jgi:hypothetical protein